MSSDLKTVTLVEASEILGVHRLTVMKLLKRGELRGRKAGRHWFITEAALREFLLVPGSRGTMRNTAKPQAEAAPSAV